LGTKNAYQYKKQYGDNMTITQRASRAVKLKDKNLNFFQQAHKNIYRQIESHEFHRLTLNIDSITGAIDVFDGKTSLYEGDADGFIKEELKQFYSTLSEGKVISTVPPHQKGSFTYPRFFSKRMNKLLEKSPPNTNFSKHYTLPNFYPMLFFTGCMTGLHIEKVLEEYSVINAVICEPDPERFYISLYIIDWQSLFALAKSKNNNIKLIIGNSHLTEDTIVSASVWNQLITLCPSFPLATMFYNHQGGHRFTHLFERVKKDMHFFLNQWGYYDDEINQMNNAFHNIAAGIAPIGINKQCNSDTSIILIGGGPSLDQRIEDLIKYKDSSVVVSCGTSIHSLIKHGIIPDYHIEIESHMLTYESLAKVDCKEFYDNTILIGAIQIPPNVFELFKQKQYFIKDSSGLAELFAAPKDVVSGATPTCTNTGIALFTHFKFKNLFLFGMDFGFKSVDEHHAKGSIYYDNDNSKSLSEANKTLTGLIERTSVHGEKMLTKPMYATSQLSAEMKIVKSNNEYNLNAYNCSEGVNIKGTTYTSSAELDVIMDTKIPKFDKNALPIISKKIISNIILRKKINYLGDCLESITNDIISILTNDKLINLEDLFRVCHKINRYTSINVRNKYGTVYFTMRGSLMHICYTGASVALSINNRIDQEAYIQVWKSEIISLLTDIPEHYHSITGKEYPDSSDPWIAKDIVSNGAKHHE
jgi:hypothetical protein